jgi:rare lipoprotein A
MQPTRCSSTLVGCVALAALLFQPAIGRAEVVSEKPADVKPIKAKHRHKATPEPVASPEGRQVGKASFYSRKLAGRPTASGERFDPDALTAAHRTLPLGTKVKVVNPKNDKSVIVTVNDRGPVPKSRMLDVSPAAAAALGMKRDGVTKVETQVVGKADAKHETERVGDAPASDR